MQSANNYGLTDAEADEIAQALQASMEVNYAAPAANILTPEQLEQIQEEAREAEKQRLLRLQLEDEAIAEAVEASLQQLSLAEQVALRARTTRKLGDSGGFKEGRGIAPPRRRKPADLKVQPKAADDGFPPASNQAWLDSLHYEGGDGAAAAAKPPRVKPPIKPRNKEKTEMGGDNVMSELERLFKKFTKQ